MNLNLSLNLSALLIPYGIVVAYVLVFSLLHLTHLAKYGTSVRTAKAALTIWMLGILGIAIITANLLQGTNWNQPLPISAPAYGNANISNLGL